MGFLEDMEARSSRERAGTYRAKGDYARAGREEADALAAERRSADQDARRRDGDNRRELEQMFDEQRAAERREREFEEARREECEAARETAEEERRADEEKASRAAMQIVDLLALARRTLARIDVEPEADPQSMVNSVAVSCLMVRKLWDAYPINDPQSRNILIDLEEALDKVIRERRVADARAVAPVCEALLDACQRNNVDKIRLHVEKVTGVNVASYSQAGFEQWMGVVKKAKLAAEHHCDRICKLASNAEGIGLLVRAEGLLKFSPIFVDVAKALGQEADIDSNDHVILRTINVAVTDTHRTEFLAELQARGDALADTYSKARERLAEDLQALKYYLPAVNVLLKGSGIELGTLMNDPAFAGRFTAVDRGSGWHRFLRVCYWTAAASFGLIFLALPFKSAVLAGAATLFLLLALMAAAVGIIGRGIASAGLEKQAHRLAAARAK